MLSIAGIAGVCLAIVGWTQRGTGPVAPLITTPSPSVTASSAPAASSSSAAGPPLSSQQYASYAYQVWPGPLSSDARLAMAGFVLKVTRQANGITVSAVQDGQKMTSASHFYPGGARVYVIDSSLGDEGGSVDYNVTDDGLVVTNARGQVLP